MCVRSPYMYSWRGSIISNKTLFENRREREWKNGVNGFTLSMTYRALIFLVTFFLSLLHSELGL